MSKTSKEALEKALEVMFFGQLNDQMEYEVQAYKKGWKAATKAMLDACCDFMIEIDDTYIAEGSLHKTLYDKIERWVGDE